MLHSGVFHLAEALSFWNHELSYSVQTINCISPLVAERQFSLFHFAVKYIHKMQHRGCAAQLH